MCSLPYNRTHHTGNSLPVLKLYLSLSSNSKGIATISLPSPHPTKAFQEGLPYPQITSVLSFSQICQVDQCSPGPAPAEVF